MGGMKNLLGLALISTAVGFLVAAALTKLREEREEADALSDTIRQQLAALEAARAD